MKYAITAFFLFTLTLAIPFVYAETTEDAAVSVDADTQIEVESMDSSAGAQIRFLQLERELQRKVIQANTLIAAFENRAERIDVTPLKDIVAELEVLIEETRAAAAVAGTSSEVDVRMFVTIKHDAKLLIKQFRETVRDLVTPEDREAIKKADEAANREKFAAFSTRIEAARMAFTTERMAQTLERAGAADADLVARVRAGETSMAEARAEVNAKLSAFDAERRRTAVAVVEAEAARRRAQAQERITDAETRLGEVSARMETRFQKIEDSGRDGIADRLRGRRNATVGVRTEILGNRGERIVEAEERAEVRSEVRSDREQRIEDLRGQSGRDSGIGGELRPVACSTIGYPTCDARTVGNRCHPRDVAAGYECVTANADSCFGTCAVADSDMNDDVGGSR